MCGIFGIINNKKERFNKPIFNILGIQNDTRGGDSCGIFIDGNVEYGINETKLYSKFHKKSILLNETSKCKIALGHCRKASVGNISLETAQPVVLYNDKGGIEFVVIHNGTIHNYESLAEKYIPFVDIKGMTDSQVMTRIFYYKGYDVLNEYIGGAVFVIIDYREIKNNNPKILFFKGKSKSYSYSTTETEERPFYFVNNEKTLIFSSIDTYLEAIFDNQDCYTITSNSLIEYMDGNLYTVKKIDRSNCFQTYSVYQHYNNPIYGYSSNTTFSKKEDKTEIEKENNKNKTKDKVFITSGFIYENKKGPIHGCFNLDEKGNIYNLNFDNSILKLWFWDGVLLYGYNEFIYLKNVCSYYNMNAEDVKYCMPELLNYLSPYPILESDYVYCFDEQCFGTCLKASNPKTFNFFTGVIFPFLSNKSYIFNEGIVSHSIYKGDSKESVSNLKTLIKNNNIEISDLYNMLYDDCN